MTKAPEPRLERFPYRLTDNVRFADLDPNQHVNNAVYGTYFETSRVMLTKDPSMGLTAPGLTWILVRLDIHYRAELHWPGTIELGLGVAQIGRSSAHFDQGVFSAGRCVASARAITVMIDQQTRRPVAIPQSVRDRLERWRLRETSAA